MTDWISKNKPVIGGGDTWGFTKSPHRRQYNEGNLISSSPLFGGSAVWDISRDEFGNPEISPTHEPCGYWTFLPASISSIGNEEPPPPPPPPAPGIMIRDIKLDWTDTSSNELGFRIQRKLSLGSLVEAGINPEPKNLFVRPYSPNVFIGIAPDAITPKVTDLYLHTYKPTISIVPDWADYVQLGANITTYTDLGVVLTTGDVYSYRVYAYNEIGNSDYSNVVQTPSIPGTAILTITTFAPTVG